MPRVAEPSAPKYAAPVDASEPGAGWREGVVAPLAAPIARAHPDLRQFHASIRDPYVDLYVVDFLDRPETLDGMSPCRMATGDDEQGGT